MCGRFSLTASGEELAEVFGLDEPPDLAPRYNIAPTQPVATVRSGEAGGRTFAWARWGLDPASPGPAKRVLINVRAEGAGGRPPFREAFTERRCLVAASGFYEWRTEDGQRRPYYFHLPGHRPFAFAGLWEPAPGPDSTPSCTILTVPPNELVRPVHDRMPAIVAPDDYPRWLDARVRRSTELRPVLRPYPAAAMAVYPVGPAVNDHKNEGPALVVPDAAPPAQAQSRLF
jgi:putative SOS response-associated peptidase YedK